MYKLRVQFCGIIMDFNNCISVIDFLLLGFPLHSLQIQYRMNPLLFEFPLTNFYPGALITSSLVLELLLCLIGCFISIIF